MAALSSLVGPKPTGVLRLALTKMTVAMDGPLDVTVAIYFPCLGHWFKLPVARELSRTPDFVLLTNRSQSSQFGNARSERAKAPPELWRKNDRSSHLSVRGITLSSEFPKDWSHFLTPMERMEVLILLYFVEFPPVSIVRTPTFRVMEITC